MKYKLFVKRIKNLFEYALYFSKWVAISLLVGGIGGVLGSLFHFCIDAATDFRSHNTWLVLLLPVAAVVIRWFYHIFKSDVHLDTNLVIRSLRENNKIPVIMIPLIFLGTVITQFFGGSAGREGAALQLGGSVGYNLGRLFRIKDNNMQIIVMAGMSGVFSALFGTPITAAVFSLEVASVGMLYYTALLPCFVSAIVSYGISRFFGISPVRFDGINFENITVSLVAKTVLLSVLLALLSILFCFVIEKTSYFARKFSPGGYFRAVSCSLIVVALTFLVGTYDYNGAGMFVVERAMTGQAQPFAFALKLLFTALSLAAGFKGGEIVPAFFVGSTFGCVFAPFIGMDPAVGAAIGFVALFCGVVNCPLASLLLSVEVFGTKGLLLFAISCGISYMLSGYFGLYTSQRIVYSKTNNEHIDKSVD